MSKNKEPEVETIHLDAKKEEVDNLLETSLGVTKNPNTGIWEVMEFKYNSVNGKVRLETRHAYTDRLEAINQFKVMAAQKVLQ